MIPHKNKYKIIRRPDDNTYDIFYDVGNGKLDFVSNHDTYTQAAEELKPVTKAYAKNWSDETLKTIKETFEEYYNKQS